MGKPWTPKLPVPAHLKVDDSNAVTDPKVALGIYPGGRAARSGVAVVLGAVVAVAAAAACCLAVALQVDAKCLKGLVHTDAELTAPC